MTHTYAILEVTKQVYKEIKDKLEQAGYQHAFNDDNVIDMHGIAIKEIPRAHNWIFYMNGTFCKNCNAQLGDGREECK